jgi:membrane protease subunit HflC
MNNKIAFGIVSLIILFLLARVMLFIVDQRQFGVIYTWGKIDSVVTEPGLVWKLPPPIQTVTFMDKRLRTLDSSGTDTVRTIEKQNIEIDWFVRWRITDPASYIRNVGLDETARAARLSQVVRNAFIEETNKLTVEELLSDKRNELMGAVMQGVRKAVGDVDHQNIGQDKSWGITITDVRLTRLDYPKDITESVYRRMQAERQRVANELRATGQANGEAIRADADKQSEIIIANAYKEAQTVKGEGDASATAIYAKSFGQDPEFAAFTKGLESLKSSFKNKSDLMVIDNSSEFFEAMRGTKIE